MATIFAGLAIIDVSLTGSYGSIVLSTVKIFHRIMLVIVSHNGVNVFHLEFYSFFCFWASDVEIRDALDVQMASAFAVGSVCPRL